MARAIGASRLTERHVTHSCDRTEVLFTRFHLSDILHCAFREHTEPMTCKVKAAAYAVVLAGLECSSFKHLSPFYRAERQTPFLQPLVTASIELSEMR